MTQHDRQSTLIFIEEKWLTYCSEYEKMSQDAKTAFLYKQGYARFADLLAHLCAWWKMGMNNIERYRSDMDFKAGPVDVDAFNARAVAEAAGLSEQEVIEEFRETLHAFKECVEALTDKDLEDDRVQWQLNIELFGHYEEHRIEK